MTEKFDPVEHNRAAWDREVAGGNEWTVPVGPEVIARARAGDWSVVLIGYEPTPRDDLGTDRHGPFVTAGYLAIPGGTVVLDGIELLGHSSRS